MLKGFLDFVMKARILCLLIGIFALSFSCLKAEDSSDIKVRYIAFNDGRLIAIPEQFIAEESSDNENSTLVLEGGEIYAYNQSDVVSVSYDYLGVTPHLISFAFTNADNDQVYADVIADITDYGDTISVMVDVPVIGKRLRPSFVLSDSAVLYVDGEEQISGYSSHRFETPKIYTLAQRDHWIYDIDTTGVSSGKNVVKGFKPLGRPCKVDVEYLTDLAIDMNRVPTIYLTFGDAETWDESQWIGQSFPDGRNTKDCWIENCTFRLDGAGVWPDIDTVEGCEIRGRGNSSWSWDYQSKNPYRIKFPKNAKQTPFNLKEGRQWVLIANKKNGSMTTNSIAQKIAAMVDAEAICHMIPVDLYVNGHYRGSYCFTEKIGVADNSVAIDEATGCLLELDVYYDEDYKFRDVRYNLPVNVKDPDFSEEVEDRIVTFKDIQESFNTLTVAMDVDGDISSHINMESWAKYWLVNDLVYNGEVWHPKSCYLFNPNPAQGEKWVFGPAWDFDWACGYKNSSGTYFESFVTNDLQGCDFFKAIRESKAGKRAYYREWSDFMEEGRLQELMEYIDDYTEFALASILHNNDADIKEKDSRDYLEIAELSKKWLSTRADYIFSNLDPLNTSVITLTDGEEYTNCFEQEFGTLKYVRTLPNLQWNSLYVPFEIPLASISDRYEVADINSICSYDINGDGVIEEIVMEVNEKHTGMLKANSPYLIRAKTEAGRDMEIVLQDAKLFVAEENSVNYCSDHLSFQISGTYKEKTQGDLNEALIILEEDTWKPLKVGECLNPYRLYLTFASLGTSFVEVAENAIFRIEVVEKEVVTNVKETPSILDKKTVFYDLNGHCVYVLQKGRIYVVNGKKLLIR